MDLEGRVQAHRVKLEFKEQLTEGADSAERLAVESAVEVNPRNLKWGTRESLLRGGRLAAAASREYLHFQGFAYQGIAKADLWGSLLAGQVHVLQNGEAYEARRSGEYFFPKMHFPSLMLGSSLSCQNRV